MILGITGGVGAGKSSVLAILEKEYNAKLILADEVGREKARECGKIGGRRERGAFSVRDERHRARSAVFFVAADRVERGAVQLCGEPHAHGIGVLQPGHGGEPAVRGRKAAVDAPEQRVPVIQHRALCAVVPFDGQTEAFREKTHARWERCGYKAVSYHAGYAGGTKG